MTNIIGFEVTGQAMLPTIGEGNVVHVNTDLVPEANGKDIGLFIIGDNVHLARYTRYGSKYILLHENAPHTVVNAFSVEILGLVVNVIENHSAGNTMASVCN